MGSYFSSAALSDNDKCREKRLRRFETNPSANVEHERGENSPLTDTRDRTEDMVVAARNDYVKYAQLLLCYVDTRHYPGLLLTLAHNAAASGSLNCLKLALQREVEVNSVDDKTGWQLIHWAAGNGHVDCISLLLEHGTSVDAKTNRLQFTALQLSAEKGHVACVRLLLQHGADKDGTDIHGYTALNKAAARGHVDCARELMWHPDGVPGELAPPQLEKFRTHLRRNASQPVRSTSRRLADEAMRSGSRHNGPGLRWHTGFTYTPRW